MANAEVSIFTSGSKGYGAAGASHTKRNVKGFRAESGSPREDIDANNRTIRQRCRMLYMSTPIAASGIKTNRTNSIGSGLNLNPKIDWKYLGISAEQAEEWEENVKAEFQIWAGRKNACDATGMNDFYEIQQLAFISWLISGDVFVLLKREEADRDKPYTLRLHVIEADRCSTPQSSVTYLYDMTEGKAENGNKIYDGVEVEKSGKVTAYHIRNTYPYQMTIEETSWVRVKAYGDKTGLPNIIHIMSSERPEQYRGVSYLAQIIEPMLQMRRYTEAEITAAIIESFFTAFIKTGVKDKNEIPFNDVAPEKEKERYDPNEYEMGPGQVNVMNPGEEIQLAEPKRPASGFGNFVDAMCTQMGAALEIPADLLMKKFNASYSASRGALLEAWKSFRMYRKWFASDFCNPIYEVWLSEAVAIGRVNAPGFWGDRRTKEAWMRAEWVGPSQGQLDPGREIAAEVMSVAEGFSTYEDSTIRINGGNWTSNMNKLEMELRKKEEVFGNGKDDGQKERGNPKTVLEAMAKAVMEDVVKELVTEMKEEKEKDGAEK